MDIPEKTGETDMLKSNLHTHSTYSDGKNTPEEIIQQAIKIGLTSIGFTEHADDVCSEEGICMKKETYPEYFSLIDSLKEKYRGKIHIYKGLELDAFSYDPEIELDYTIGSVHYIHKNDRYYSIDDTPKLLKEAIVEIGGQKEFLISYFDTLLNFAKTNDYDITGHFDLYTKFNEIEMIVDTDKSYCREMALNALEEVVNLGKIIEINTGAISRGYRTEPYPQKFLLDRLIELKAHVIIESDSHSISTLTTHFKQLESIVDSLNITFPSKVNEK